MTYVIQNWISGDFKSKITSFDFPLTEKADGALGKDLNSSYLNTSVYVLPNRRIA